MSNGDKKPGLGDISDLKARLGMLNKGGAAGAPAAPNPFGPKPTGGAGPMGGAKVDLGADPDAVAGGDTAVVRIGSTPPAAGEATPAPRLGLTKPGSAPPAPATSSSSTRRAAKPIAKTTRFRTSSS